LLSVAAVLVHNNRLHGFGMEALIKRDPDNNVVRAAYCILAVEAGDKEAAVTAF